MKKAVYGFFLCFLVLFFCVPTKGIAQKKRPATSQKDKKTESNEPKMLEKITKEYIRAYDKVTQTKDKNSVLKYLDKKLSSVLINTSIRDKVSYLRSNYGGFEAYLAKIIATPKMKINYKLTDISKSYVGGSSGLVVYSVKYENIRDGKIWVKGKETVSLVFRKIENDWKIIHYTVIGFENEKFKGACLCELFAGNNSFVAKTAIPQGKGYFTESLSFSFSVAEGNKQKIMLQREVYPGQKIESGQQTYPVEKAYFWEANGEIWDIDEKEKPKRKLGVTSQKTEAVYIIVKDFFKEPCDSFKVRR